MKRPLAAFTVFSLLFAPVAAWAEDAPASFGGAMRWYEKAASAGSVKAQFLLGRMHETGQGREADPRKAAAWYRRAAERGYAPAQFRLGVLYVAGRGVRRDPAAGAGWYRKAAAQGHQAAIFNLAFLYDRGIGVAADKERAEALYREVADAGFPGARFNLGLLLADHDAAKRDRQIEAWMWLKLAAEDGVANAAEALAEQNRRLSPGERAEAAAMLRRKKSGG